MVVVLLGSGFLRRTLAIIALAFCSAVIAESTHAQDRSLPQFDVEQRCAAMLTSQGYRNNMSRFQSSLNQCIDDEQFRYDYLKSIWEKIPENVKNKCLSWPPYSEVNPMKYTHLSDCIEPELRSFDLENGNHHFVR